MGAPATRGTAVRGPALPRGEGAEHFSRDPLILRHQLTVRCAAARDYREPFPLAAIVTELYLSAVDAAHAAEALILGGCGPLEAVVGELVAQGGAAVVAPVTSRASLLGGAGAQSVIETAVAAGLDRARATPDPYAASPTAATYILAHFSSRSGSAALVGADALNALYAHGIPGFGLYTFLLLGPSSGSQVAAGQSRSRELLRVIATYVPGDGSGGPSPDAHAFLVAVHPERQDLALPEQTGPELSDAMRRQLVVVLRRAGHGPLASRLEARPGPFLISSPEPRLLPESPGWSRLIVDLSGVGSEYLFSVVDAFDRAVPPGAGLEALRERLLALPLGADGVVTAKGDWVSLVRGAAASQAAR